MYDKYVQEYAQGIADKKYSLADGLFNAEYIMSQYKWEIWNFLEEIGVAKSPDNPSHYRLQSIEWDDYDRSIELMDCEEGFTLTQAQYDAIKGLGFEIIFINYAQGPHLYGNYTAAMDAMPVIKD